MTALAPPRPPRILPTLRARLRHDRRWRGALWTLAPLLLAAMLLAVGYLLRAPGTSHPDDYQSYGFRTLSYSDIIWLYLRDNLARHPRPYLDYRLEYPPLTGALSYALGFAPSLRAYFALAYVVLAASGLAAVVALGRLPGVNRWYLAATPALILYTGLNWDLAAIAMTALALVAYTRGRDGWGTLALLAAVWLKFFPLVFLAAILVERLRERRFRACATIAGSFALGSVAINGPLARANLLGWAAFFTSNTGRPAEPSLWTFIPSLTIAQINGASLALLALGGLLLTGCALRARQPTMLAYGATLLLWWLFVNKVYSPQYALWVYLALALLAVPRDFWRGFVLFDLAYYFASFQILFTIAQGHSELVAWQARYLLYPLVVVRLVLLAVFVGWGTATLLRHRAPPREPTSTPAAAAP